MHDTGLDFSRQEEWPKQRVSRPVSTRANSKCDARETRPVLLVAVSRCEAVPNLRRNTKTREVDERKEINAKAQISHRESRSDGGTSGDEMFRDTLP